MARLSSARTGWRAGDGNAPASSRPDPLHLGLEGRVVHRGLAAARSPIGTTLLRAVPCGRLYHRVAMRVKFCGITRLEDAREAVRLGAWAIGLNH